MSFDLACGPGYPAEQPQDKRLHCFCHNEAFAAARMRPALKCESSVKNLSSFTAYLSSM